MEVQYFQTHVNSLHVLSALFELVAGHGGSVDGVWLAGKAKNTLPALISISRVKQNGPAQVAAEFNLYRENSKQPTQLEKRRCGRCGTSLRTGEAK